MNETPTATEQKIYFEVRRSGKGWEQRAGRGSGYGDDRADNGEDCKPKPSEIFYDRRRITENVFIALLGQCHHSTFAPDPASEFSADYSGRIAVI
jgi:hypothetical protein